MKGLLCTTTTIFLLLWPAAQAGQVAVPATISTQEFINGDALLSGSVVVEPAGSLSVIGALEIAATATLTIKAFPGSAPITATGAIDISSSSTTLRLEFQSPQQAGTQFVDALSSSSGFTGSFSSTTAADNTTCAQLTVQEAGVFGSSYRAQISTDRSACTTASPSLSPTNSPTPAVPTSQTPTTQSSAPTTASPTSAPTTAMSTRDPASASAELTAAFLVALLGIAVSM